MQTFEQWWNEIEGYGLRAERFTTPGDAAKASWDQAMSLHAQADARPVGHFFKASRVHPWVQVEKECPNAVPLYTHPEASAPGLSHLQDEIALVMQRWAGLNGGVFAINECALDVAKSFLTRASAATVGGAKMPDTSDDPVNLLHRVLTIAGFSSEDAEYQKLTDALIGAAQQQAEPGADERAAFEAAYRNGCAEVTMRRNRDGRYEHNVQNTAWKIWQAARAAQSGQRAGVAEGWQLVPKEPTKTMLDAAERLDWSNDDVRGNCCNQWNAMLAAAPTHSEGQSNG